MDDMRNGRTEAIAWLAAYVALACAPLLMALAGPPPPPRGAAIETGVALGFIGLGMFWAQFALTARFRWIAGAFGTDALLQFHRQAGIIAYVFVLAHPALLIAAHPAFVDFLDPRVSLSRAGALIAVLGATTLIVVSTLWRLRLGIRYDIWRWLHAGLSVFIVFVGFVHVLRVGYYVADPLRQLLVFAGTAAAFAFIGYTRVISPWRMRRSPWRVAAVNPVSDHTWSVMLEPVGHHGIAHAAGQFVWVSFGASPYTAEQHPFSIASRAADGGAIELAVRELGDFTGAIGSLPVGETAYVDGPHGAFVLPDTSRPLVLVAGGIGISPLMAMLRTLAHTGDDRPVTLLYAASGPASHAFAGEIDALRARLALRVELSADTAPAGWTGHAGRLDAGLLARLLPSPDAAANYLICGPDAMMDTVELYLRRAGVSPARIDSERFNIA